MESDDGAFDIAVQHHDDRVAQLGVAIWVGSEPTFTDRQAQSPAWLHAALVTTRSNVLGTCSVR
jgi:hypothetical protein